SILLQARLRVLADLTGVEIEESIVQRLLRIELIERFLREELIFRWCALGSRRRGRWWRRRRGLSGRRGRWGWRWRWWGGRFFLSARAHAKGGNERDRGEHSHGSCHQQSPPTEMWNFRFRAYHDGASSRGRSCASSAMFFRPHRFLQGSSSLD